MNTARKMSFEETVMTSVFGTAAPTLDQIGQMFGASPENVGIRFMDHKLVIFFAHAPVGSVQSATFLLDFKTAQCVVKRNIYGDRGEKSARQVNCKDWSKLVARAMAA